MYKLLLCWRYLRTRYIALASIVSVMLGVATMIVVNSVMLGFTTEMQNRLHGILSDVIFQSRSLEGFPDAQWHMDQIRSVAGDRIEGMTAVVVVPAMLSFQVGDNWITRQVQLIGIDAETQSQVSDFAKYLQHPENRRRMSFQLREGGYDVRDHQAGPEAPQRSEMALAGWQHRRLVAEDQKLREKLTGLAPRPGAPAQGPRSDGSAPGALPVDPWAQRGRVPDNTFDPGTQQYPGVVVGIAVASFRKHGEDRFLLLPGDDVKLTFPTAGTPPKAVSYNFTIVDFYESKMSEYDANFAFVPIRTLQELRGMIDPGTGKAMVNAINIRLKPGTDLEQVRDLLRERFAPQLYHVETWRDNQGPLLAAVHTETAILNVLLFLIIAVAGFGILAIFFMIVVEKTKDIGILKSLGASGVGVMQIFLSYGLALGLLGSGVGLVLGLLFVQYINQIAGVLAAITGQPVFDPDIYYFYKIPAIVDAWTVTWVVAGAVGIAVLASIVPACRAARLRPVEALRYE